MRIQFTTAESAFCPTLKTREGHEDHISQPHLPFSSLPNPAEPLEILSFPIAIHSETAHFNPKTIANLWLQLLVIQVQNANFWNYEDIVKVHNDKAYKSAVAAWKAKNPQPMPASGIVDDPKPERLDKKTVLFLRHKLQKGFLSPHHNPPPVIDFGEMSKFVKHLEDARDLEAEVILATKIHNVLIAICKLDPIPRDEEFIFRARCEVLIAKWLNTIGDSRTAQEGPKLALIPEPPTKLVEPQPAYHEVAPGNLEDFDPTPAVCITQLTPDQCAKVETLAHACDPPLDRAVIELACMLPQFSAQNEHETYQIVPFGQLISPLGNLENNGRERRFKGWGPVIPPHILQLTEFTDGCYGRALYVDTETGEGIVFKEYHVKDFEKRNPKWEDLIGERRPIDELLREWIDNFLEGRFMPSGGKDTVHEEGPRSVVDILMDILEHKALLHEYGWPQSFPLPASQYHDFLKRKNELHRTTFYNNSQRNNSLAFKWINQAGKWRDPDFEFSVKYDPLNRQRYETLDALDNNIKRALDFHEQKIQDREYALAADVPMQSQFMQAFALGPACNIGDGWRIDTTPEMMLQRFEEVFATSPEAIDEDTAKMREILSRAYSRRKEQDEGIYEPDYWSGEDDDSSSDYEPESEEMDYEDDEEYEDDEDTEDLDTVVLRADMADDVEVIRAGLAEYQIGED